MDAQSIAECIYDLMPYNWSTFCILGNVWIYVLTASVEAMCAILLFFLLLIAPVQYISYCCFSWHNRHFCFLFKK